MSLNRNWLGPAGLCLMVWASPVLHAQPKPQDPNEGVLAALRELALQSSAFDKQVVQLFQIHNEGTSASTITFQSLGGPASIVAYDSKAHLFKPTQVISANKAITLASKESLVLEFSSGDCKATIAVQATPASAPMLINIYGNGSKDDKRFFWKFQSKADEANFGKDMLYSPSDDPKAQGGFGPYIGLSQALNLNWD